MRDDAPSLRILPWAIFVFAFVVRLAGVAGTIGFSTPAAAEPASDSRIHMALVHSLLDGHAFRYRGAPTAITPPLYIFFLAGLYRLFGHPAMVRLAQVALGAAGCVLLYAIGRRMFNPTTGLVAAALLSVSPVAVYLAGLHLTENLFLPLLLLILLLSLSVVDRPTLTAAAGLGGLLGLAALTRAAFIAFLPFVLIWTISLWGIRNPLPYRVFGLAAVSALLVIMPWTVRNYSALGSLVPVQSNAGAMFWAGNNPYAAGGWTWPTSGTWTTDAPPDDGMYGWRGLTVAQDNKKYMRTAIVWIREHPGDYLGLLARKLVRLYGFTRAEDARTLQVPPAVVLFHVLFLTAAAAGALLVIRHWRRCFLLLALIIFTNVTALLFSGGTRYTIPMIPSLALFAAVALVTVGAHTLQTLKTNRLAVGQLR
jgi:4-amino-4-deoxy-L-arabinose transferase-like glycosyltransferase